MKAERANVQTSLLDVYQDISQVRITGRESFIGGKEFPMQSYRVRGMTKVKFIKSTFSSISSSFKIIYLFLKNMSVTTSSFGKQLRKDFHLNSEYIPINQGSYGANPKSLKKVMDAYREQLGRSSGSILS